MNVFQKDRLYAENENLRESIAELESKLHQWVSVKDRQPITGYYLAYRANAPVNNKIATIQYNPHHLGWSGKYKVSHWMPLPDSPKGGDL